jgi:hypothetical protein
MISCSGIRTAGTGGAYLDDREQQLDQPCAEPQPGAIA